MLHLLSYVALWKGDLEQAATWSQESVDLADDDDVPCMTNALTVYGWVSLIRDHFPRAAASFCDALKRGNPDHYFTTFTLCLEGLAGVAAANTDLVRAATLLGAADGIHERINTPVARPHRFLIDRSRVRVRAMLAEDVFHSAWETGRSLSNRDANAYALEREPLRVGTERAREIGALSARELDVLRLLADGKSDREFADALFISRHTVAHHVTSILNKLGVASRTAAATHAVREHLV